MKLPICNFDISKQLKEVGFSNYTEDCYNANTEKLVILLHGLNHADNSLVATYPLALVQMWLEKEHDIDIHITRGSYSYPIPSNMNRKKKFMTVLYSPLHERGFQLKGVKATYDQALEAGILEAIKLIKTKQDETI